MIEEFDELQWTMNFFDDAVDLNDHGIDRIRNFTFLWSIFEDFACSRNANFNAITQAVENIYQREEISHDVFNPFVEYFSIRYSNPNHSLDGLQFRANPSDQAAKFKIRSVLQKQETDPKEILVGLLFILYRFRNNLFHGNKPILRINEQISNFTAANKLLTIILDTMKRNSMI